MSDTQWKPLYYPRRDFKKTVTDSSTHFCPVCNLYNEQWLLVTNICQWVMIICDKYLSQVFFIV